MCPGSQIRSQIWPGTSSSMWFFEVATPEITIRIFKFVWEILPIGLLQPTTQTWEKHQHPPFFWKMRMFFQNRLEFQNLPYTFKKSYGDFQDRNFEKSHGTTGPRSYLRPDLWSWANSGLDSTFGNVETGSFWVTTRGASANRQCYQYVCRAVLLQYLLQL